MVTTEIRFLGPPTLTKKGRPVRLHSARTLALLAYLVLEADTVHSREKLAELLWGESPEPRARQSLRQALYSMRRMLGTDAFAMSRGTVSFEPGLDIWVDVVAFQSLAVGSADGDALDDMRRASDLYRGLLLEGLELSECPTYDEWLFFQRDSLEQQAMTTLQNLVDGLLEEGDPQDVLAYAQRLVLLDPLHEGAHRRLMRIHGALSDRDSVRRQYRLCADVLEHELGVTPAAETEALYRQLISVQPTPTIVRERRPPAQPKEETLTLPFLGRAQDLAVLGAQFDRALKGQGRLVLVSGEAGVGKTRLVEEFLRRCTGRTELPVRFLAGRCYAPESRAPYAMWADALQGLSQPGWQSQLDGLAEVWQQQLARLVPALGVPADEVEGTTLAESRLRLLQGIVQAMLHLSRACVLCLWFDDLHWADEASLELLHYVSRHTSDKAIFIIGTYRTDTMTDNPDLDQLLKDSRRVQVVELASLDKETIHQMLLGLNVPGLDDLTERLYQNSGGNPLFLTETLNALSGSDSLRRKPDGSIDARQVKSWPVPRRIQDLIQARMASLDEEERRALAAGAVIARPFGLLLLRQVSGLPEIQALDVVEQALRQRILEELPGSLPQQSLSFHHPYYQRVIYDGLSTVQRHALHRRAARALLQIHRARPQTVTEEVAHHFEQSRDPEAITYLAEAAQQAEALYAYQHAAELYSRALRFLGEQRPGDLERCFDLLLGREAMLDRQGLRTEQAEDVMELVRLAEAMEDQDRLAIAKLREAGCMAYTGQYDAARQAGERALELYRSVDDKVGEAQALRELGFLHWSAEDYGTALTYVRDALQLHRRRGEVEGEATALHNLAEIHRSLGSPRQAVTQYEASLNLYWARQDRRRQALALYGMAHALRQLGDREGAFSRYKQALTLCEVSGDRLMASRVHHALAGIHWERGALDQSLNHMERAVDISREIGYGPGIAHGLFTLSNLQAQEGRLELARQYLQEAISWLHLTEDKAGLARAQAQLHALEQGTFVETTLFAAQTGWVKGHVALAEGKVYCTFESPLARR
jgi:DNA-binding SARP family transcriptional activator/tetratricopeptide (TPR) repeat protein